MFTALNFLVSVSWMSWTKDTIKPVFIFLFSLLPSDHSTRFFFSVHLGQFYRFFWPYLDNNRRAAFSNIKNQSKTTSNLSSNFRFLSSLVCHGSRIRQISHGKRNMANFFIIPISHFPSSPLLSSLCSCGSNKVRERIMLTDWFHGSTHEILPKHFFLPAKRPMQVRKAQHFLTCVEKRCMLDPGISLKEFRFSRSTYKERT